MRRFPIKRSPPWRALLALMGATTARSYLEIDEERLVARFGWYRLEVPRARIAAVAPGWWPWWRGIGGKVWRGRLGLIGTGGPVLCVRLTPPVRTRLSGLPLRVRELCVSVDDPAAVRAALEAGTGPGG